MKYNKGKTGKPVLAGIMSIRIKYSQGYIIILAQNLEGRHPTKRGVCP
jgi:hypothetical protein